MVFTVTLVFSPWIKSQYCPEKMEPEPSEVRFRDAVSGCPTDTHDTARNLAVTVLPGNTAVINPTRISACRKSRLFAVTILPVRVTAPSVSLSPSETLQINIIAVRSSVLTCRSACCQ